MSKWQIEPTLNSRENSMIDVNISQKTNFKDGMKWTCLFINLFVIRGFTSILYPNTEGDICIM